MRRLSDMGPLRMATTIALTLLIFAVIWLITNLLYAVL